jgi:hypothetical protein
MLVVKISASVECVEEATRVNNRRVYSTLLVNYLLIAPPLAMNVNGAVSLQCWR